MLPPSLKSSSASERPSYSVCWILHVLYSNTYIYVYASDIYVYVYIYFLQNIFIYCILHIILHVKMSVLFLVLCILVYPMPSATQNAGCVNLP